jgi:hypothetical protein
MRATSVLGVMEWLQQIKEYRIKAQEALQKAKDHMIKETKYYPFNEGEKVWLEGTHLKLPYNITKLAPRWYGLFKVVTRISDVAYQIKIPNKWKIHNIFHALWWAFWLPEVRWRSAHMHHTWPQKSNFFHPYLGDYSLCFLAVLSLVLLRLFYSIWSFHLTHKQISKGWVTLSSIRHSR